MSDATLESEKAKIEECLCVDLLSSKDSDEDGSFIIHPLPWRSQKVDDTYFEVWIERLTAKNLSEAS